MYVRPSMFFLWEVFGIHISGKRSHNSCLKSDTLSTQVDLRLVEYEDCELNTETCC